jgi:hypothetical protein
MFYIFLLLFIFSRSAAQRGLWPPRPRGFLVTHNDAPHSVWLHWMSDQLVADTSTWQHTQQTNIHAPGGIRIHERSRRAAVDLCLRQRGYWDRHIYILISIRALGLVLAGTRAQPGDRYGSGTLQSGQVLRGSLPLLFPAFRRSHFRRQMPPRPQQRERS